MCGSNEHPVQHCPQRVSVERKEYEGLMADYHKSGKVCTCCLRPGHTAAHHEQAYLTTAAPNPGNQNSAGWGNKGPRNGTQN